METPVTQQHSASRAEIFGAFVALAFIALFQIAGARCFDLFRHPLWLDETFTYRIANDPSFTHMIRAVTNGVDTNPPTLYLFLWPIARMLGSIGNVGLRAVPFLSMIAGMTGLYAICRRYFSRGASAVAVLAIWAHPLIIDQAFEARFYAPWFALTVWFCYFQMLADQDEPAGRRIARYALAILATSIHYFGVIAMLLIGATDLFLYRRIKRLLPIVIGLLVVAACFPFIRGQRAGLSIPTWIDPVNAAAIKDDVVAVFGAPSIIFAVLLMWIARLLRKNAIDESRSRADFGALLPFSSLMLMPIAIVAFSVVVQPALVLRYLILSVAPLAPLVAALLDRAGRRATVLAGIGMFGLGAMSIIGKSHATRGLDREFAAAIEAIDQRVLPGETILFKRRREMYPILQIRPDLAPRIAQLDFDDAVLPRVTRMSRYERDMGRKAGRVYPDLRVLSPADVSGRRFYVVAPIDEYEELNRELPGFEVSDPDSVLHEVVAKP